MINSNPNIKDVYIEDRTIYFVSDQEMPYKQLIDKYGAEYNFIRVPSLTNKATIKTYPYSSQVFKGLSDKIGNAVSEEVKITLSFKDETVGFDRSKMDVVMTNEEKAIVSEKKAYIYNGDLDWDSLTCHSLAHLIYQRRTSTQRIVYISNQGEETQTYSQLYKKATLIAQAMFDQGMKTGDKAIFQFNNNRNFIETFWACMILGVVVVPVGVLEDYKSKNVNTDKLAQICNIFGNVCILCDDQLQEDIAAFKEAYQISAQIHASKDWKYNHKEFYEEHNFDFDTPCIYLFTSGSTGTPKGVGLTQRNIFARTLGEIQMYNFDHTLSDFNWMTLTHAAGIIWSHIRDVYLDAFQVQADTSVILKDPIKLLEYIHKFKSTTSWAPNFAYALLAKIIDEKKDYGWDLSRATNVYTAGETNVSKSLREFLKKTAKYGFPEYGLIPSFGMTETSSCITYYNEFSYATASNSDQNVSIGTPIRGIEIRITDSDNQLLNEGEVGYVQIKGETLLNEYHQNPDANKNSFTQDGFLITGDLGYILDHNVTLTGREKDIVIINGLNYYIQDIENVVDEIPGVEEGCSAVISVQKNEKEEVVLFFSPSDENIFEDVNERKAFIKKVRREIQLKCFITLDHVIPIDKTEFSRTEIGKKQRAPLKKKYESGIYEDIIRNIEEIAYEYVLEKKRMEMSIGYQGHAEKECKKIVDYTFINRTENYTCDDFEVDDIRCAYKKILDTVAKYTTINRKMQVFFPILYNEDFSIEKNAVTAILKTLALENSNFSFKVIFMDAIDEDIIQTEIEATDKYEVVIYQEGKRYIEAYYTAKYECMRDNVSDLIDGKVTVIPGGFGGIGRILCDYLTETYKDAHIAVIGRREEAEVAEILSAYKGYDLRYYQADVCSFKDLNKVFERIKDSFPLDISCIFNLAVKNISKNEEISLKEMAEQKLYDAFSESAIVKLMGIKNLENLRAKNNAVMYSFSSITSEFGWKNMSDYASSNLLLENYSKYLGRKNNRFISFGVWNDIGLNERKSKEDMREFLDGFNTDRLGCMQGFTPEKGIRAIENILSSDANSCYCGIDRQHRSIQYLLFDPYVTMLDIEFYEAKDKEIINKVITENYGELKSFVRYTKKQKKKLTGNETSKMEERVKLIWEEILGISIASYEDNLFDLGGNSLSVFAISESIYERLGLKIKPVDIMTYSTIQSLSDYLNKKVSTEDNVVSSVQKRTVRRRKLMNR